MSEWVGIKASDMATSYAYESLSDPRCKDVISKQSRHFVYQFLLSKQFVRSYLILLDEDLKDRLRQASLNDDLAMLKAQFDENYRNGKIL